MAQHAQQQVNYRRGYPMRQCAVCSMYAKKSAPAAFGSCTAVTGKITPFGLCDLWKTLNNPWGNRLTTQHRRAMERIYDHARGHSSRREECEHVASHCSLTLILCFSRSTPCASAGAKNTMNANKIAKQIAATIRLATIVTYSRGGLEPSPAMPPP